MAPTRSNKRFWPFRSITNGVVSSLIAVGSASIGIAYIQAKTVAVVSCVDSHISDMAKKVYDTNHAKYEQRRYPIDSMILLQLREIRIEQKRVWYVFDENVPDNVLARAAIRFKKDSTRWAKDDDK